MSILAGMAPVTKLPCRAVVALATLTTTTCVAALSPASAGSCSVDIPQQSCSVDFLDASADEPTSAALALMQHRASFLTSRGSPPQYGDLVSFGSAVESDSDSPAVEQEKVQLTYFSDVQCLNAMFVVNHALGDCENSSIAECSATGVTIQDYESGACVTKNNAALEVPLGQCVSLGPISVRVTQGCGCNATGNCTVFGDPHIQVFDRDDVNLLSDFSREPLSQVKARGVEAGDYWLVKSEQVQIQARYGHVEYPGMRTNADTFMTHLAIGGPFLEGNILTVEPRSGNVTWLTADGKANDICAVIPSIFHPTALVNIDYHQRTKEADPQNLNWRNNPSMDIKLPRDVRLIVTRLEKHLNAIIEMPPDAGGGGGLDGQCGNFNGIASDDTGELISKRAGGQQVQDGEILFDKEREVEEVKQWGQHVELSVDEQCVARGKQGLWKVNVKPVVLTYYSDPNCELPIYTDVILVDHCNHHGYMVECASKGTDITLMKFDDDSCEVGESTNSTLEPGRCYAEATVSFKVTDGCGYEESSSCNLQAGGPHTIEVRDCAENMPASRIFTVEPGTCQMGWNLTCGCSADGEKVIVAEHYSPNCTDRSATDVSELPIGKCFFGMGARNDRTDTWSGGTIIDDLGVCPDCGQAASSLMTDHPHIRGFDQVNATSYDLAVALQQMYAPASEDEGDGDDAAPVALENGDSSEGIYWIMHSKDAFVQGRYAQIKPGQTDLAAVAFGGHWLKGNILTVEADGAIAWRCQGGEHKEEILSQPGATFEAEGILIASRRDQEIELHFPNSLKVILRRTSGHVDVDLTVPRSSFDLEDVDGLCGNYNGDPFDDRLLYVKERMVIRVPDKESLFESSSRR